MIIRQATTKDSFAITKIAFSIKLNLNNPQKNGFLVYILSKDDYAIRIKKSKFFYVAEDKKGVIGFLMCYDSKIFKEFFKIGKLNHENKISDFVIQQKEPYIFGDQIGIYNNESFKGVGSKLMEKLFEEMKKKLIKKMYVAILHKPIFNEVSFNFCKKFGFREIKKIKNSDGYIWGIYELKL